MEIVRRGYEPGDGAEFGSPEAREKLNAAARDLLFLLDGGYNVKSAVKLVGDRRLLSARQRLALVRITAAKDKLSERARKELKRPPRSLSVDGFNTVITLETALSGSLLLEGMDGTVRDLAGLRGSYRVIDKTFKAAELLLARFDRLGAEEAVIYLDAPVSNSGRLRALLLETARGRDVSVRVELIANADGLLAKKDGVVTSDAVILDRCKSWYNLNRGLIKEEIPDAWIFGPDRAPAL